MPFLTLAISLAGCVPMAATTVCTHLSAQPEMHTRLQIADKTCLLSHRKGTMGRFYHLNTSVRFLHARRDFAYLGSLRIPPCRKSVSSWLNRYPSHLVLHFLACSLCFGLTMIGFHRHLFARSITVACTKSWFILRVVALNGYAEIKPL